MLKSITYFFSLFILVVITLELIARIVLFSGHNNLDTKYNEFIQNNQQDQVITINKYDTGWANIKPHPYIGYNYSRRHKNNNYRGNNHGFNTPQIFPYKKDVNEFVIAIFGGSLAEQFSGRGTQALKKYLKQEVSFQNLKITIINYAIGAFKQPQSFISSSIYANDFDIAIVIDGFNEVTNRSKHFTESYKPSNDTPFILPHFYEHLFKMSKYKLLSIGQLAFQRHFLLRLNQIINNNFLLRNSSFSKVVWLSIEKIFDTTKKLPSNGEKKTVTSDIYRSDNSISARADIWDYYTRLQHTTLNSLEKKIFTFIQPNHHYRDSKPLHQDEQINNELFESINTSYPLLISKAKKMSQQGLNIFNLTGIFKNNNQLLYVDSCHLNNLGYELMAKEIFIRIKNLLNNIKTNAQ